MKKLITLLMMAFVVNICQAKNDDPIKVIFQNNSGKKGIMKFKLTIENPDGAKRVEELAISGDMLIRKELNLAIGSKVYVDNGYKLNTLVGGKAPAKETPFMTVMARDKNQTINLVEETNATEAIVLTNAAKAAAKLKMPANLVIEIEVTGNIATVFYKDANGYSLANFDCDKKSGNIKNINDTRKKKDDQGPAKIGAN
jgi:hypothetical protein